jgi:hypothetical protein
LEASQGGVPEFTPQMEKEEQQMLNEAWKAVIKEQEWSKGTRKRVRAVAEGTVQSIIYIPYIALT